MSDFDRLIGDIKGRLDRQEASGWFSCYCPVCKEERTRTGGFYFETDSIVYNCFRGKCDANCALTDGEYVSKKFKHLMSEMGVDIPISLLTSSKKLKLAEKLSLETDLYMEHIYKAIKTPDGWVHIDKAKTDNGAREYFKSRCIDDLSDVFIITKGDYKGCFAVRMSINNKPVGFHIITQKGRYVSHFDGNDHIIYVPDRHIGRHMIVVEGTLDAKSLPFTAATLSNRITRQQAYFLRNCESVIMLPDRSGGNKFIDQFHEYGWNISIPNWPEKDLNAAVQRYGKFVAMQKIVDGVVDNRELAMVKYRIWTGKGD